MACPHVESANLSPPQVHQHVYREDCTRCFDCTDDPAGLDVCLSCFDGGCAGPRQHSRLHHGTTQHPLVLNIQRTRKRVEREEPPQKISKLAINAETEADRYDTVTKVRCLKCAIDVVDASQGRLPAVVESVMRANTYARQEEVKAWEQEITPCEHTLLLKQDLARKIYSQDLGHCSDCELRENLWLCLQCGSLGCGRAQFGGVGGHSHAMAHADNSHHPIAVKLGSLTPEGTADIYCYTCNDERTDPDLARHLAHWGINIAEREKTEKSLTELQIEQNLRWEFSMTTEDGKELKPLFGEGLTGLKNLGNSCYLASILQCLFALPVFQERYRQPANIQSEEPAQDLEVQLRKLADGLLSGRYSKPDTDVQMFTETTEVPHQKGLAPAMFKHLIGRGHEEFSTMRQQDAFELLLHLFKLITRSKHAVPLTDPVKAFQFVLEQRLQCVSCRKVKYQSNTQDNISIPVPVRRIPMKDGQDASDQTFEGITLTECLDIFTADEHVELTCSGCGSKVGFTKRHRFKTFPDVLAVNARRFETVNWVPTKVNVPVIVADEPFTLDRYLSMGIQSDEELLPPDTTSSAASTSFHAEPGLMTQLEDMGFPSVRCEKALHATGNADIEAATAWLMQHMDDPDIDERIEISSPDNQSRAIDPKQVESLGDMGFGSSLAKKALRLTDGDVARAVEWLFSHPDETGEDEHADLGRAAPNEAVDETRLAGSETLPACFQLRSIVCHKGGSIHAGHYVAFVRRTTPDDGKEAWVLYNDEKVVKAVDVDDMKKFAYVYFFSRL